MPATAHTPKNWAAGELVTGDKLNVFVMGPLQNFAPAFYTVQTTNATPTALFSEFLGTMSAVMVYGSLIAERSDHSAGLHARFGATFRRAAGNIVLAGSFFNIIEDSAGAPTAILSAVAPNLGQVIVTGVAGQTWDWKAVVMRATL